jgi:hypothetical protein
MTLPVAPNPISLSQVNTELGLSSSAPITLNTRNVRVMAQKLTGKVALSDLHGKKWNRHTYNVTAYRHLDASRDMRGYLPPGYAGSGSISPTYTYLDGTLYALYSTTENLSGPGPTYSEIRMQMFRPLSMGAVWTVNVDGIDIYNTDGTVLLKSVNASDISYFSQADTVVDSVNVKMTWIYFTVTPTEHLMSSGVVHRVDIRYT